MALLVVPLAPAQAEPADPNIPTQAQVDRSKAEVQARQQRVDQLRAALAATAARVATAHQTATDAAEAYEAAAYDAVQARKLADKTAKAAAKALARVNAQRQGIGQMVAQSYQLGGSLDEVTTFMGGGDTGALMDRQAVGQGPALAMKLRLDQFTRDSSKAVHAQRAAAAAHVRADQLEHDAQVAGVMARLTAEAADAASARFRALQGRFSSDLAQAKSITQQLVKRREAALAAIADKDPLTQPPPMPHLFVPWLAGKPSAAKPIEIPRTYPGPVANPPKPNKEAAARAIAFAREQLGDMYLWAATGPDRWDCSGLTMGAWGSAGVSLPHYSEAQYLTSIPIRATDLAPGDLVFWQGAQVRIHHVALYIGNGQIIQAWKSGEPIQVTDLATFTPPDFFARPRG